MKQGSDNPVIDLEICVDSVESAVAAARGGAQRVELCSALDEGGITPSIGLIRAVRAAIPIGVFPMIRPRGGDFVFSDYEFAVMQDDIHAVKEAGANGIALGLMTPQGAIDVERTRRLVELAQPLQVTFHRAFDEAAHLDGALEQVIATGASRLLTSGGEPDSIRGMRRITELQQAAAGRIRIMAGGGIRESNVRRVALQTGVRDIHTSLCRRARPSRSGDGASSYFRVSEEDVRAVRTALDAVVGSLLHEPQPAR